MKTLTWINNNGINKLVSGGVVLGIVEWALTKGPNGECWQAKITLPGAVINQKFETVEMTKLQLKQA